MFYYRKLGDALFQEIPAVSQTGGKFEVEIGMEQEDQPAWSVEYKDEVLCKYREQLIPFTYEYYITLKEGNQLKSSETDKVNLDKLVQKYASLDVIVAPERRSNEFEIRMFLDEKGMMPEKIYLEIYNGNQLVEKKELENAEGEDDEKVISWKAGEKQFDRLCLSVEYKNRKVFKKEIWNKEISERS